MVFDDFDLSKNEGGLLPAIIQDARTRKVLMLGYMNREAFEKSAAEGLVTFYSRTRGRLWTKGETSGNFLHIKKMYKDCDSDTLLVEAIPDGPTCHRGTLSCFDTPDSEGFLGELAEVIRGRHEQMPEGSYTTKLFIKGVKTIAKKVGEEATEMVIAAKNPNDNEVIYEMSDFLYHMMVLMAVKNVSWEDITDELSRR